MSTELAADRWYVSSTGNHQGLIISETTGENIAVTYDRKHAPLVARAPALLSALDNLVRSVESGDYIATALRDARAVMLIPAE